jgi:hypothetical protein
MTVPESWSRRRRCQSIAVNTRRIHANRRNAAKSTGPRSASGRAKASRNAWKHGLSAKWMPGPALRDFVQALSQELAENHQHPTVLVYARSAAEAALELARVRTVIASIFQRVETGVTLPKRFHFSAAEEQLLTGILSGVNTKYRTRAGIMKAVHELRRPSPPTWHTDPLQRASRLEAALPELCSIVRFEARAISRLDRAMQGLAVSKRLYSGQRLHESRVNSYYIQK